jgi:hypothetical protein
MHQVQIQMTAAMQRYQDGPPANRTRELDTFSELMKRSDALTKQYDALWRDEP